MQILVVDGREAALIGDVSEMTNGSSQSWCGRCWKVSVQRCQGFLVSRQGPRSVSEYMSSIKVIWNKTDVGTILLKIHFSIYLSSNPTWFDSVFICWNLKDVLVTVNTSSTVAVWLFTYLYIVRMHVYSYWCWQKLLIISVLNLQMLISHVLWTYRKHLHFSVRHRYLF